MVGRERAGGKSRAGCAQCVRPWVHPSDTHAQRGPTEKNEGEKMRGKARKMKGLRESKLVTQKTTKKS